MMRGGAVPCKAGATSNWPCSPGRIKPSRSSDPDLAAWWCLQRLGIGNRLRLPHRAVENASSHRGPIGGSALLIDRDAYLVDRNICGFCLRGEFDEMSGKTQVALLGKVARTVGEF